MQRQVRNSKFFCSQALYVMLSGWSVQCCNVYFIFLNGLLYFLQQLIFNEHKKLMCIFYNNLSVLYPCWKYYPKFFFILTKFFLFILQLIFLYIIYHDVMNFYKLFGNFPIAKMEPSPKSVQNPSKLQYWTFSKF